MRVLLYDIETSPIIGCCFGIFDQNIPIHHIIQDWHIVCFAYKWLGDDEIQSVKIKGKNDKPAVRKLASLFEQADAVVAHNGDNFDYKKFMARVIQHGMPPVKKPVMIDTLKMARKFGFTSKKLDFLASNFGFDNKLKTEKGLWIRAALGEQDAIDKMDVYCRGDIPPLESLYLKLRPYLPAQLNQNLFTNGKCCPSCGSERYRKKGMQYNRTSSYQRLKCMDCGHNFRGKRSYKRADNR